jgi:stage II sporulation protein AB (anti-sigma F factor)
MNNLNNEMKLEFLSKSSNEAFARITVAAFAAQLDPTIEELADIKTAVSEAVTNCVIHGYDGQEGIIYMNMEIDDRKFIVKIRDTGVGIQDIDKAMEPMYTTKGDKERSGMGFCFMEAFMDELSVESTVGEGTTITMKKVIGEINN